MGGSSACFACNLLFNECIKLNFAILLLQSSEVKLESRDFYFILLCFLTGVIEKSSTGKAGSNPKINRNRSK